MKKIFSLIAFIAFILSVTQAHAAQKPVPMDAQALSGTVGGSEATVISDVHDNVIGDIGSTGTISGITASGNSGLTTMIQNTGNQVSISTATVVNVNLH